MRPKQSLSLEDMLRVDHAGENAAVHMYRGQLRVLGHTRVGPELEAMLDQEAEHYTAFEKKLQEREIAPTIFQPLWEKAAYSLGIVTALLGPKAAMACTEAVEDIIVQHYHTQIEDLRAIDPDSPLIPLLEKTWADEQNHRILSQHHQNSEDFSKLKSMVQWGCRFAIRMSQKI